MGDNLIPIIGVNESGKSTVLQAILAFDRRKDNYIVEKKEGEHLDPRSLYELEKNQKDCYVKAEVVFENEAEVNQIADEVNIDHADPLKQELLNSFKNNIRLTIIRSINTNKENRKYSIEGLTSLVDKYKNERLAERIFERTPPIIYFSDKHLRILKNPIIPKYLIHNNYI